jgi:hypothetical protein
MPARVRWLETEDGSDARWKRCAECRGLKLCTEGPDSAFWVSGRQRNGRRQWHTVCKACVRARQSRPRKPAGPFADWLAAYELNAGFGSCAELADALGICAQRVTRVLARRQPWITLGVVDTAVMNASRVVFVPSLGRSVATLDDLYPLEEVR